MARLLFVTTIGVSMTIDWFVLLVPIALLVIVLLFAFVGCALNREGVMPQNLVLHFDSGFDTDVKSIEVTFKYSYYDTEIFHEVLLTGARSRRPPKYCSNTAQRSRATVS